MQDVDVEQRSRRRSDEASREVKLVGKTRHRRSRVNLQRKSIKVTKQNSRTIRGKIKLHRRSRVNLYKKSINVIKQNLKDNMRKYRTNNERGK